MTDCEQNRWKFKQNRISIIQAMQPAEINFVAVSTSMLYQLSQQTTFTGLKNLPPRTANLVKMSNWNSRYETDGAFDNWASGIFASCGRGS